MLKDKTACTVKVCWNNMEKEDEYVVFLFIPNGAWEALWECSSEKVPTFLTHTGYMISHLYNFWVRIMYLAQISTSR